MLPAHVQAALNDQINLELASSYAYLAMAAHFEVSALPGMANWMRMQSEEERVHAMRLFDHMIDRGGKVVLQPIEQPMLEFDSPLSVFEAALGHEQTVTEAINSLYRLAEDANDYASQVMLQWFINEQVEEEKNAQTAIEQLRMAGSDASALLMLDQAFGSRTPESASRRR
ncbi:MAG: ferritin [Gemmatimonadales bacterium]